MGNELSSLKIKTPVFFRGTPLGFFKTVFSNLFIFHHWFLQLFFGCFHCWLHFFTSPIFFTLTAFWLLFCQVLCFCTFFCTASATDLRELFFNSQTLRRFLPYSISPHLPQYGKCYGSERDFFFFYLWVFFLPYTLSQHLAQPAFIKASLGAGSSSLKVAGPPTEVRNRSGASVCLNHTGVLRKVLVGRSYLCVKALWNTISTSSRFWTHTLIATYNIKCISYPLDHISS